MPGTSNSLRILGVVLTEGDKGVALLVGKKIIPLHTQTGPKMAKLDKINYNFYSSDFNM